MAGVVITSHSFVSRPLLALGLACCLMSETSVANAQTGTLPQHDAAAMCINAPTRACVLELAQNLAVTRKEHRQLHLCEVALAQAKAGRREQAEAMGRLALADIDHMEPGPDRNWAIERVVEVWIRLGKLTEARQLAEAIIPETHRMNAVIAVAVALGRAGRIDEALQLARTFEHPVSRQYAIRRVAWETRYIALARGEEGKLIDAMRGLQDEEERPGIYMHVRHDSEVVPALLIMAEPLALRGRFAEAWSLATAVKDHAERIQAQITAARIQARSGDVAAALRRVRLISDAEERYYALYFNLRVLTYPEPAAPPADEDSARENAQHFVTATAQNLSDALDVASAFADKSDRAMALGLVAASHIRRGDIATAQAIVETIEGDMARHLVLRAIGRALAAMGQTAQSIETFDKALALARTFEPHTAAITSRDHYLSALAIDQANAGQIEEALRVVKAMDGNMSNVTMGDENIDEERRTALYYIAKAQAKAGKIAEALETARTIRRKSGTLGLSVGVVAEGLAEVDRMADALEAVRFADNPSETLTKIARGRAVSGKIPAALQAAGAIEDAALKARALGTIGRAQEKAGMKAEAAMTFAEAVRAAQSVQGDWYQLAALLFVAELMPE